MCGKTKSLVTGGWHYYVKLYISGEQKEAGSTLVQLGLASFEEGSQEETLPASFWEKLVLGESESNENSADEHLLDATIASYGL